MTNLKTVENVALKMNRETFSGEVKCEVPFFDDYLSRLENIDPRSSKLTHFFGLEWAKGLFQISVGNEDQVSVGIKLYSIKHYNKLTEWLWEFHCTFSIFGDHQKLFNVSWNKRGLIVADSSENMSIEEHPGFNTTQYLAAAKALGKSSTTLRIVLQYQAVRYYQGAPEYTKPELPGVFYCCIFVILAMCICRYIY